MMKANASDLADLEEELRFFAKVDWDNEDLNPDFDPDENDEHIRDLLVRAADMLKRLQKVTA